MPDLSPTTELKSIKETAAFTGVTPALLRIWQLRYKWPIPLRTDGGHRRFTYQQVQTIMVVAHYLKLGRSIGSFLADPRISPIMNPEITLDILYPPRGRGPEQQFTDIPRPASADAQLLRKQLVAAINDKDLGRIAQIQAAASRLSPTDRHLAVTAVLEAASKQKINVGPSAAKS